MEELKPWWASRAIWTGVIGSLWGVAAALDILPEGLTQADVLSDQAATAELADRGLDGISVTATGCLKACDRGPILVVYPDNVWYGGIEGEDQIDAVLDALEAGSIAEDLALG